MRLRPAAFFGGLLLLAAACAAPSKDASLEQSRLAQAESRAAALARSGDFAAAAAQYAQALRIARSLENAEAIAANAINLSVVQQWLGRDAEARAALAAVLDDPRTAFSERRRLQAELRRAILELAGGNAPAAEAWIVQAESRCPQLACDYAPTILNVRAQAALESSRPADAARLAQTALERARSSNAPAELANAMRTLGRARQAQGEPAAAIALLKQALELDRELGDPRKILADLTELARAAEATGDAAGAREYRERSLVVSRAMNDARSTAELEALLKR